MKGDRSPIWAGMRLVLSLSVLLSAFAYPAAFGSSLPPSATASRSSEIVGLGEQRGQPVAITLHVDAVPGRGRVLFLFKDVLFGTDFQLAIEQSDRWLREYRPEAMKKWDLVISVRHNFQGTVLLDGKSLGAAAAVVVLSAIDRRKIRPGVLITATLESDGSLGPVTYIHEKAEEAYDLKAKLLLVASTQTFNFPGLSLAEVEAMTSGLPPSQTFDFPGLSFVKVTSLLEALPYILQPSPDSDPNRDRRR